MATENFTDAIKQSTVIKRIPVTDSTQLRVTVHEFKDGGVKVDVRTWYRTQKDPKPRPGKGMMFDPGQLKALRIALLKAEVAAGDVVDASKPSKREKNASRTKV